MKKVKGVIFIDIDGVFTSERIGWQNFDIYAINKIYWCIKKRPEWKLVMSSTWRMKYDFYHYKRIFGDIFHKDWRTGSFSNRRDEIKEWLDNHPEIKDYIVIDDNPGAVPEEEKDKLIHTDGSDGMLHEHFEELRNKLNIKEFYNQSIIIKIENEMFSDFYTKRRTDF